MSDEAHLLFEPEDEPNIISRSTPKVNNNLSSGSDAGEDSNIKRGVKKSWMETLATKSDMRPPGQAECVTDSGECEVCRDVDVPIFAGLDENTGEWIGICRVCIEEQRVSNRRDANTVNFKPKPDSYATRR